MTPLLVLESRWKERLGAPAPWWERIETAYTESHRRYHTLDHLAAMFGEAERFEPLSGPVEWAIWFHDYVYDSRAPGSEEASAEAARGALKELGEPAAVIERTVDLILATKHAGGGQAADEDEALLISLDLAILAAPAERYDAYVQAVRVEYSHVPDAQFWPARAAFMRRFLEQAAIFPHAGFAEREPAARANIARELSRDRSEWV